MRRLLHCPKAARWPFNRVFVRCNPAATHGLPCRPCRAAPTPSPLLRRKEYYKETFYPARAIPPASSDMDSNSSSTFISPPFQSPGSRRRVTRRWGAAAPRTLRGGEGDLHPNFGLTALSLVPDVGGVLHGAHPLGVGGHAVIGHCPTKHFPLHCRSQGRFSGGQTDTLPLFSPSQGSSSAGRAMGLPVSFRSWLCGCVGGSLRTGEMKRSSRGPLHFVRSPPACHHSAMPAIAPQKQRSIFPISMAANFRQNTSYHEVAPRGRPSGLVS